MPAKRALYLLSVSPLSRGDRDAILGTAQPGDAVLLHQDGVFGLVAGTRMLKDLAARGVRLVASIPDCRSRGIEPPPDAVDWAGFVRMIVEYDLIVS